MADRFQALRQAISRAVLHGPGLTAPALRQAVASGDPPVPLAALVGKIRKAPWSVSDADVAELRSDFGEDELFEIVVATSVGEAERELALALRAMEDA
ncbi:MAG: hypothetical protein FJZ01_12705 [Candidatus Sericytochromatia bacterium]|nr:hypothetical protein [Candidatus Tanganyikabacteria bacterium]